MIEGDTEFATTNWDLLAALQQSDDDQAKSALEELSKIYWPPVYAYLKRRGYNRDAAADLTQAYFTEVIFSRKLLHRAKRAATPLRSLIMASLKRFLTDQHRRSQVRGDMLPLEPLADLHDVDGDACEAAI